MYHLGSQVLKRMKRDSRGAVVNLGFSVCMFWSWSYGLGSRLEYKLWVGVMCGLNLEIRFRLEPMSPVASWGWGSFGDGEATWNCHFSFKRIMAWKQKGKANSSASGQKNQLGHEGGFAVVQSDAKDCALWFCLSRLIRSLESFTCRALPNKLVFGAQFWDPFCCWLFSIHGSGSCVFAQKSDNSWSKIPVFIDEDVNSTLEVFSGSLPEAVSYWTLLYPCSSMPSFSKGKSTLFS